MTRGNSVANIRLMELRQYIEKNGGQTALANKISVSQGMVWQWLQWLDDKNKGTRITAERALEIERATEGAVTRHELRPDIYGASQ